jgi:hypothetical protein
MSPYIQYQESIVSFENKISYSLPLKKKKNFPRLQCFDIYSSCTPFAFICPYLHFFTLLTSISLPRAFFSLLRISSVTLFNFHILYSEMHRLIIPTPSPFGGGGGSRALPIYKPIPSVPRLIRFIYLLWSCPSAVYTPQVCPNFST